MIHFSQLQHVTGGKNIRFTKDWPVTTLLTDSRKAHGGEGGVFFAITGEHHDGHSYIQDLYQKGIRQFVVEREIPFFDGLHDVNILVVPSSLSALQALVSFHRSTLSLPVIGITGSNGKTIVKEWLFQVLSSDYKIAKNPGSYNSQLGVPLSVWQLQSHHGLGIFEAGISKPEEMKKLAAIIQPTIGIFTTLGSAHNEGFTSLQQKTMEKAVLFEGCKVVIYCKDHTLIDDVLSEAKFPTLTWGFVSTAGVHLKNNHGKFSVSFKGTSFTLTLPFSDKASIENCFHCVTVMLYLGYSGVDIQERIRSLESVPMRLELKEGINQSQIIDDTYNNDLAGLQISLDFLGNQHQKNKKRLILSDVLESGLTDEELARQISLLVDKHKIHSFVGIGPGLSAHRRYFSSEAQFFLSTEDFLDKADWDSIQQEAILVKGARKFAFEKIIERLQKKVHGTIMEVDLGAVVHNLNFFRARLKPSTKIMVMVKAFAYGSGSTEIANLLQYHKVDYLGVAYADEGIELRKDNITLPIMVMNPSEESFASILQYHLEPEVYSFKVLHSLIHFLRGRPCTIHVKLDTGMHRLGFSPNDLDELTGLLHSHPSLKVASVFSHLAGADEATHDDFSREQVSHFETGAHKISSALGYRPYFHVLNSPGILRLPQFQMDMVRLGIGLYGVDPTADNIGGLMPVATLKTIISQIKHIPSGESIGYGRRGKAEHPLTIATIAIGYADGFSRAFSRGAGKVLVHGKQVPVIGNVCMDMTMIDITGLHAQEGDEVIIFGSELPIQEVAASINTIPYEILTNTSERVKRVFVAESI